MRTEHRAELAGRIHATAPRGAFAVAGGGSLLLPDLLAVPGASGTVLEAVVPYSGEALAEYLGAAPPQACSTDTARAMAMRAFERARQLGGEFGFAITAALRTDRAKRGEHRAHLACQDAASTRLWTLPLAKDVRTRAEEERLVADAGLRALAYALGVGEAPGLPGAEAFDEGGFRALFSGVKMYVGPTLEAVLPGAFSPLHDGHRAMRAAAAERLGCPVGYELCIANVDKPPLDYLTLNERLAQFSGDDVVVTRAPTFLAKARALGAVRFVVGVDTLARIAEPRYYGGAEARDEALAELHDLGCRFLVFGRVDREGRFKTLDDLDLGRAAPALLAMCTGVPESEFRLDLSSTELRAQAASLAR